MTNKLTLNDIKNTVRDIDYHRHDRLMICILTLKNGFYVTGESAATDPANFDAEIAKQISLDNALRKIWMLEGYVLKNKLHEEAQRNERLAARDAQNCQRDQKGFDWLKSISDQQRAIAARQQQPKTREQAVEEIRFYLDRIANPFWAAR